jgi:hypothetical protein
VLEQVGGQGLDPRGGDTLGVAGDGIQVRAHAR